MTLACACGSQLEVGPRQLGKLVQCFRCAALIPAPRTAEEGFDSALQRPAEWSVNRRPRFETPPPPARAAEITKVAWELWVVLAVLALFIVANTISALDGTGGVIAIGAVIFGLILGKGLWDQAAWAWWWSLVANILGALLHLWALSKPAILPAHLQPNDLVMVMLVSANVLAISMLISCRVRKVY
jgi:hypothetical protein